MLIYQRVGCSKHSLPHLFRPDREIWDEKGGLIKKGPAYVGMILQPQIK
jgi:hypothetical protein